MGAGELIGVIVQARMGSQRLPGKVLRSIAGRPLLGHVLWRLQHCRTVAGVMVATTTDPKDDDIAGFCAAHHVRFFRGDPTNVAARLLRAAQGVGWTAFGRVSADSPLLDWRLVDQAVKLFRQRRLDLVTNVWPRTYPRGQSVEVIRTATLAAALPRLGREEQEHVTPYFYRHERDLAIVNFTSGQPWADIKMSVDTASDLKRVAVYLKHRPRQAADEALEDIVRNWQQLDVPTAA